MGAEIDPAALAAADWPKREGLAALSRALGQDDIRWVGGAIRDTLLDLPVADVDCATTLLPDAVIDRCRESGIRTVPTGIDHGTVTAILDDGPVEITTLRHDVSTDGRRATIAFANDWQEDAARRDFTINALYAHPATLEIFDYFGGLDDLRARRVRFIGDARERIREDHLRILRYYRFQARFGADLDQEAEEACAELAQTLKGLSRERVASELLAILGLPNPSETVSRMRERGVLEVVLPETCKTFVGSLSALISAEIEQGFAPDSIRRLAALLPPMPEVAGEVAARLRLSKAQRARLTCAAERNEDDSREPKALAYREGRECAVDRILLQGGDARFLDGWNIPQFPLKGGVIVARGVSAGPEVARIMRTVEARWIDEGFPSEERVAELLEAELAKR
ncbi:CCA tRNA nucleotidyltransferase [Altererythrobacter arenosus]|uniref:CCA tRNA nucleotidyltransferase n=1 Tax=Altererythrobacter arenosus TaxID=3032592 RepID=A0ABY8FSC2_9SPHN|nr:CCA tRNA nucleotidyltransferase [Altererythrobacter sp. CAU 1644]WFL77903.1 CCA tRNA nucleotidyltransferase [Altererythrobacter sp. CAU 1644]